MQIASNTVAFLDYELKDDDGKVLDTSKGSDPLTYLHGRGNLIAGLESELEGKAGGDTLQVRIPPEQGYGLRNEELVQDVDRSEFPPDADVQAGMQFHARTEGGSRIVTVVSVIGDAIKLDMNHPLAGVALNFDVTVVQVRAATEEELAHGHVHGPGGHSH